MNKIGAVFAVLVFAAAIFRAHGALELKYELLGTLPQNTQSFTQGLLIVGDFVYKSTGSVGRGSHVIQIDKKTGEELRAVRAHGIFGEGLAFDGTMLWQLSWREERAFVYALSTLAKIAEIPYKGEGWGLTFIPERQTFAMTDGSDKIIYRDRGFNEMFRVNVKMGRAPVDKLNELEYWHERILANRLFSDTIFMINPVSGDVENFIDLTELRKAENPSLRDGNVLNGIAAVDDETLLVTGKRWRNFYIIRVKYPR